MSLTKEVKVDKIELVNGVNLQVREVVNIIEMVKLYRKAITEKPFHLQPLVLTLKTEK